MQILWRMQATWDDTTPKEIYSEFIQFKDQLPFLNETRFNRFVVVRNTINVQIHGFCDASEKGTRSLHLLEVHW